MIAGGIGAIIGLGIVLIIILILIGVTIARWRLGLLGFAALTLWLFVPPLWNISEYRFAMWQSGYDHYRETPKTHFGVNLPDDGSLWRAPRDFLDNPAYGLGFRTHVDGVDHPVGFTISNTKSDLNFDFTGCTYADGPNGLRTVITDSCTHQKGHASDFVFTTQPDDPNPAILILHSFDDIDTIRILRFVHGDATVSAFVASDLLIGRPKLPQSSWSAIRAAIIELLDAHFVFNPPR